MSQRGVAMGTALVVAALVVTLGFALSSVSLAHLNLSTHHQSSARALQLARSALALGIEKVLSRPQPDFGADRADGQIQHYGADPDGGWLTFSRSTIVTVRSPWLTAALRTTTSPPNTTVPVRLLNTIRGERRPWSILSSSSIDIKVTRSRFDLGACIRTLA